MPETQRIHAIAADLSKPNYTKGMDAGRNHLERRAASGAGRGSNASFKFALRAVTDALVMKARLSASRRPHRRAASHAQLHHHRRLEAEIGIKPQPQSSSRAPTSPITRTSSSSCPSPE
ncbi:hypothetical protein VPNG_09499 [Cytospora leucostoma]|uniref:Uncharacterized protein n=1 Tax=Cytospora leucostoma TaxID=1230097 RepID=A0A423VS34_9PEZI|nr:hypothetical protein VPNG_09499 [Cytospora leucostoma]